MGMAWHIKNAQNFAKDFFSSSLFPFVLSFFGYFKKFLVVCL